MSQASLTFVIDKASSNVLSNVMLKVLMVISGVCALTVSAKVQVPMPWGVPITMQTLVVLVIGSSYGWRMVGITILAYYASGFVYPVFANPGLAPGYFAGPTAGYLIGFLPAAVVVGFLAERGWDKTIGMTILSMIVGNLIIYSFGTPWLASIFGWAKAIDVAVLPYLFGDLVKIAIAALALPTVAKLVGRS